MKPAIKPWNSVSITYMKIYIYICALKSFQGPNAGSHISCLSLNLCSLWDCKVRMKLFRKMKKNRKDNFFFRQEKADVPNVAYTKVNQCPQIGQKMLPFCTILKFRRWILGQAPASCLPSLLLLRLSPKICKSHDYYSNIIKCYWQHLQETKILF